jgi:hypothetical protein
MQKKLVNQAPVDLDALRREVCKVTLMTEMSGPQWAAIVDIAPSQAYTLDPGLRHDLYVLQGNATLGCRVLNTDDFLIECGPAVVSTGAKGVRLFHYSEALGLHCEAVFCSAKTRVWRTGRYPQMRVAPFSSSGHRVSLVSWQPGARTADHAHPNGEEMLVLNGELRNSADRYAPGTWLRLQPGERHELFAEVPTVILLRTGHLNTPSSRTSG